MPSSGLRRLLSGASVFAAVGLTAISAQADPLGFAPMQLFPAQLFPASVSTMPRQEQINPQEQAAPPEQTTEPQASDDALPDNLRRQIVSYRTNEAPGTIVVDTPHTYLYYVLGNGKAIRYGIGVGRDGFTWSGTRSVGRKAEWPDWIPPEAMLERQPYLPRWMAGGPGNPLGARAMYLAGTEYRIHGTNAPQTIGHHVSSGCIRLINADVEDLYQRVNVGTKVVVLPNRAPEIHTASHSHRHPQHTAAAASLPSVD